MLGAALYFYDPIFLEICAHLGFQVIWIEMEHAPITFAEAADLCRMAAGTGMLTMIRIPDARRESVLKAAECGPDIIDIPMVDTPKRCTSSSLRPLRPHRRPRLLLRLARRSATASSTASSPNSSKLNTELCLMAQIETNEALRPHRRDSPPSPTSTSSSAPPISPPASESPARPRTPIVTRSGRPTSSAPPASTTRRCIAAPAASPDVPFWLGLGIDLLFCTNDIVCLKKAAGDSLEEARDLMCRNRRTQIANPILNGDPPCILAP